MYVCIRANFVNDDGDDYDNGNHNKHNFYYNFELVANPLIPVISISLYIIICFTCL